MAERSIAELIGWRRSESASAPCWRHEDGRFLWAFGRRGAPPDVSVDDMLSWLRARLMDRDQLFINCHIADVTDEPFLVRVIPGTHDDPRTNHRGRTLLEAVERCVRAVAEST